MSITGATTARDATQSTRSRVFVVLGGVVFVVVATVAQVLRQSGMEMWRTVWAEDGARFYADALARPLDEIVLESYAGYAHVMPRILAAIGVALPAEWYSVFVTTSSAVIASALALFVYFASAPLLQSRLRQAVLAGALLFWPVLPYEVVGAICNIHWLMPTACLLAVLLPVERPMAIAVRLVIVVLAPLSSPLCVLFAPIALWQLVRAVRRREPRARLVVPATYLGASALQVLVWVVAPSAVTESRPLGELGVDVAKLYSTKVTTEFFFGVRATEELWDSLGYVLAAFSVIVVVGVLAWRFWRSTAVSRVIIGACALASGFVYASSIWQRTQFIDSMLIDADASYNFLGMRYQLFPAALLLLAMLVSRTLTSDVFTTTDHRPRVPWRAELRDDRLVAALAVVWVLVAFVPSYRLPTPRSVGPDWFDQVSAGEQACVLDPGGAPLIAISPAPTWQFAVPCSELRS